MAKRHQRGYIFRKGNGWYLRYRDTDTSGKRPQRCRKLADYSDRYRSKSQVKPLAEEFLRSINESKMKPESALSVAQFVETHYLPAIGKRVRPSTLEGYRNMWRGYLRGRLTKTSLRDFRCADGDQLLAVIAAEHRLTRMTFYHIKSFLSGVFKYARRQGVLDSQNPMRDVSIPTAANPPSETYAYSLEEVLQMIKELPDPAKTVVAAAAFSGLSKSELRGLDWLDYRDGALHVSRSIWRSHVGEPKTPRRRAAVPVIPLLAETLDEHRKGRELGPVFRGLNGQPLNLDNLVTRVIKPTLRLNGLTWRGWHAFRRGLATNLKRLGVDDKTIQRILRHSDVTTTQNIYIKTVPADAVAAMARLEQALRDKVRPN